MSCHTHRVRWTHFVIDMVLLIAWAVVAFTTLRKPGWRLFAGVAAMFVLQLGLDVYDRRSTTHILITVAVYLIGTPAVMGMVMLYRRYKRRTASPHSWGGNRRVGSEVRPGVDDEERERSGRRPGPGWPGGRSGGQLSTHPGPETVDRPAVMVSGRQVWKPGGALDPGAGCLRRLGR